MEFPTVAVGENDDEPKFLPNASVAVDPVNGVKAARIEHTEGLSVENTRESRPTEAAESSMLNTLAPEEPVRLRTELLLTQAVCKECELPTLDATEAKLIDMSRPNTVMNVAPVDAEFNEAAPEMDR